MPCSASFLPCRGINAVSELLTARRRGGDENSSARPAFDTRSFITYSAIGLRQMLPWQIKKSILVMVFSVLFRCAYCTTTERKCAPQIFGVVCHCGEGLLHYGPITVPFLSSAQKIRSYRPVPVPAASLFFRSLRRTRSDCRLCRQRGGRNDDRYFVMPDGAADGLRGHPRKTRRPGQLPRDLAVGRYARRGSAEALSIRLGGTPSRWGAAAAESPVLCR